MKVSEIMSAQPAWCTAESKVQEVAKLMAEHDCGAIPVLDGATTRKPVGVITDRDIVIRLLAEGRDPMHSAAKDAMTPAPVTLGPATDIEDAARALLKYKLRRAVVVSDDGACIGMLALADLAGVLPESQSAHVLKHVSTQRRSAAQTAPPAPSEAALDQGLGETFPASDPVSVRTTRK